MRFGARAAVGPTLGDGNRQTRIISGTENKQMYLQLSADRLRLQHRAAPLQ